MIFRQAIAAGIIGLAQVLTVAIGLTAADAQEAVTLTHGGLTLNGNVVLAEGQTLSDGGRSHHPRHPRP